MAFLHLFVMEILLGIKPKIGHGLGVVKKKFTEKGPYHCCRSPSPSLSFLSFPSFLFWNPVGTTTAVAAGAPGCLVVGAHSPRWVGGGRAAAVGDALLRHHLVHHCLKEHEVQKW